MCQYEHDMVLKETLDKPHGHNIYNSSQMMDMLELICKDVLYSVVC